MTTRSTDKLFLGRTKPELIEAAEKAVLRMCNGDRRWQMTVPVQWDDSDTCLIEVIRRYRDGEV